MSTELQDTIFLLRDESRQLTADALAKQGDQMARWQRSQEIKALATLLGEQVKSLPVSKRPELESALGQVNNSLIFLLAPSNRPEELAGEDETTEAAVRRVYKQSLQIAGDFALGRGDRDRQREQAETLRQELMTLAKSGANQRPEWQRMLSDANLDLTYVTSDGTRPHSTRLAHYIADARRSYN